MRLACALMLALLAAPGPGQDVDEHVAALRRSLDAETRRCEPQSRAWTAGQHALAALHKRITGLADHDPPGPVLEQVVALLSTECFRFALESPRMPSPDTALSLKQWWEHGGHDWLASYLELPELGPTTDLKKHVVVPPDTRRTLRVGAGRAHLKPLLCALEDPNCAADTRGWRTRAESFLALHRAREKAQERDGDRQNTPATQAFHCMESAAEAPDTLEYRGWRDCVEWQRAKRWTLPLGRLKAPTSGCLIVSGRRGHYSFCETIGAYDLGTGAAYIAKSCSDLVLREGESVDRRATERAARSRTVAGTLRLDNVHETAWALLLLKEAEEVQAQAEFYPLPTGLMPVLASEEWHGPIFFSRSGWLTTAQTTLDWSWVPNEGPVATSTLTWPNSPNGVEEHAAGLLEVAEGTLIEGCPPSAPPPIELVDALQPTRPVGNGTNVPHSAPPAASRRQLQERAREFHRADAAAQRRRDRAASRLPASAARHT